MSALSRSAQQRELLLNLTLRDVRSRYKRTVLGNAWSLINPLAAMAIYTVVFGFFLRVEPEPGTPSGLDVFALWLLCGAPARGRSCPTPWVPGWARSLNANLVLKVYLPRTILVASAVLAVESRSWSRWASWRSSCCFRRQRSALRAVGFFS